MNKKSWVFFYAILFAFLLTACGNESSQTMETATPDNCEAETPESTEVDDSQIENTEAAENGDAL